jgi:hypothetical protein
LHKPTTRFLGRKEKAVEEGKGSPGNICEKGKKKNGGKREEEETKWGKINAPASSLRRGQRHFLGFKPLLPSSPPLSFVFSKPAALYDDS